MIGQQFSYLNEILYIYFFQYILYKVLLYDTERHEMRVSIVFFLIFTAVGILSTVSDGSINILPKLL